MGTCYSKAGHEASSAEYKNKPKKKMKENLKNGQTKNYPKLTVEDCECDFIQTDVGDTVYTEDSHTINVLDIENCMNRSQQTSLDHLLFKDTGTKSEVPNKATRKDSDNDDVHDTNNTVIAKQCVNVLKTTKDGVTANKGVSEDDFVHVTAHTVHKDLDTSKHTSDSGIEIEQHGALMDRLNNASDNYSAEFESKMCNDETNRKQKAGSDIDAGTSSDILNNRQEMCSCICHNSCRHASIKEHSSNGCMQNDESRQSVASIDSESCKISDSSADLEKIKLAIGQPSASTSPNHSRPSTTTAVNAETSYDLLLPVSLQQPEVMRMNMNGRDVVVVDADLFSQIIDEVQLLKMKLTHLTQIIQESDDGDVFLQENNNGSILSSSS